jgi:hypothetical protein
MQLGVLFFTAPDDIFRLQGHAADRAIAGMILFDVRMHRAGVDILCRGRAGHLRLQCHSAFRTCSGPITAGLPVHGADKSRHGFNCVSLRKIAIIS